MNTPNFAEICWGDYLLDGRIVPYKKFEANLSPIEEEIEDIIAYYTDMMYRDY